MVEQETSLQQNSPSTFSSQLVLISPYSSQLLLKNGDFFFPLPNKKINKKIKKHWLVTVHLHAIAWKLLLARLAPALPRLSLQFSCQRRDDRHIFVTVNQGDCHAHSDVACQKPQFFSPHINTAVVVCENLYPERLFKRNVCFD